MIVDVLFLDELPSSSLLSAADELVGDDAEGVLVMTTVTSSPSDCVVRTAVVTGDAVVVGVVLLLSAEVVEVFASVGLVVEVVEEVVDCVVAWVVVVEV